MTTCKVDTSPHPTQTSEDVPHLGATPTTPFLAFLATSCAALSVLALFWCATTYLRGHGAVSTDAVTPQATKQPQKRQQRIPIEDTPLPVDVPPTPPARVPAPPEQQEYCSRVKAETMHASTALTTAHKQGNRETVTCELKQLSRIFDEQLSGGHAGLVALTEFCNAVSSPHPTTTDCVSLM